MITKTSIGYLSKMITAMSREVETRDGRPCIKSDDVVIENTLHKVEKFFVKCNNSLNHKAWNVTEKQYICKYCYPISDKSISYIQLKLF